MTLRLMPEILDSIDVISSVCEELGMIDPHMMTVAHIESIVGLERIGVNNAVGCYFSLDDRQQSLRPCVWDNGSENLPDPFKQAEHGHFSGYSFTSLSFASSSEVTFYPLRLPRSTRNWEACLQ
jgi:hypothetical protein